MFKLLNTTIEKRNNNILLYHQNINRFSGKILDVELLIDKHHMDILCFSETWLKCDRMIFNINNFVVASVYNRDTEGGGTMILCNSSFKFKERKDITACSVDRLCEVACAEIEGHIIICVYRPPSSNLLSFLNSMEVILSKICRSNCHIFVCGDLNINLLIDSPEKCKLVSLFKSFNLNYIFDQPTRITATSASCIDNIFTNCNINKSSLINGVRSDHIGQLISFDFIKKHGFGKSIEIRSFTKNKIQKFYNDISSQISKYRFSSKDPDTNYSKFFFIINDHFNKTFPKKIININNKFYFNDWATLGIRKSRDTLYNLYYEKSLTDSSVIHNKVRNYSKIFKNVCIQAKSMVISNKIASSTNKIKTVWQVINKETGNSKERDYDICLSIGDRTISGKYEVAKTLEDYFTNILTEITKTLQSSCVLAESLLTDNFNKNVPNFEFKHITPLTITKSFKSLNVKITEDLWGISVKILTVIVDIIAPVLAGIFNQCVDNGSFPELMKHSKVIPIFKSGCKSNPSNYRPISVLPSLSKIFEKIMLDQMMLHFNLNLIIHSQQFGFTKGRSTTDAGVELVTRILGAWEDSKDAIGIFCDLSKAFDCVDHNTLIRKLHHYGVRGRAADLVTSYLSNRQQKVSVNGAVSSGSLVKVGVPQGSILGPFLFLVYINDLSYVMTNKCNIILFADDTSLIFKVDRKDTDVLHVNDSLEVLSKWFAANNLLLNNTKTKCLKFTLPNVPQLRLNLIIDDNVMETINETVFLGIHLDSKLQWAAHINRLANRLSSAAFAVRKIRQLTDVTTARLVYFAYFHSIMSYGILLWGSGADVESIFILQKRAVRAIFNMGPRESLKTVFKDAAILTLPSLYILENIMYVRKNLQTFNVKSDLHNINTRYNHKIIVPKFRLTKTKKSFLGNGIRFYNKLPKFVTELTDKKFKAFIKRVLIAKAYYNTTEYADDREVWQLPTC